MNRLQAELRRLYLPHTGGETPTGDGVASLIDAHGQVRALVLALSKPADWTALSAMWQGVQADLGLPAPAIAVSGTDSYQLWFSLAEAVPVQQAASFLDALRLRYLRDTAPERVSLLPAADALAPQQQAAHARLVPALQAQTGNWSAFIAPDLAPVFADTPWLDIPPSLDGQADLLSRLDAIQPADWQAALARLFKPAAAAQAPTAANLNTAHADPKRFLTEVMNDQTVALALRIEAAKALLPYTG